MARSYRMDRRATKTRGEREDEEVERLVRPSPKVKPPRHDRRRERVEVDADPDLDNKDKDLSRNFKDIGGSVAGRVLRRWAANPVPARPVRKVKVRSKNTGWVGWISQEKLKEEPANYEVAEDSAEETFKPKQKGQSAPQSEAPARPSVEKDMTARNALRNLAEADPAFAAFLKSFRKPDSDISQFAKNNPTFTAKPFMQGKELPEGVKTIGDLVRVVTLQGEAPKSKKAPKQAPPPGRDQLKDRMKEVKEELKEDPKSEGAKAERAAIREALKALDDYDRLSRELEETKAALSKLQQKGPPSDEEVRSRAKQILKREKAQKPAKPAQPALAGQPAAKNAPGPTQGGPPAVPAAPTQPATAPAPGKPTTAPAQPGAAPPSAVPPPPSPAAPVGATPPQTPQAVPPPGQAPGGAPAQPPSSPPVAGQPPQPASAPTVPAASKQAQPVQPDRQVTEAESEASDRLILQTFPKDLAVTLLMAYPRYHPDEIQDLVSRYNQTKSLPVPSDVTSFVNKASSFYATDPGTVPAPQQVRARDGSIVDFKSLTDPEEQGRALREHQVQTVAMSLAAASAVASTLENQGAPKELAGAMSQFMLSGRGESPKDRMNRAKRESERLFYLGLQASPEVPALSDGAVRKLMQSSDDPALQRLMVGYCQANDYQQARKRFLDPTSKKHISEHQSPDVIAARLMDATDFLRRKAKRYPEGKAFQDTYKTFRARVMKHLGNLTPGKHAEVEALLDTQDAKHYEQEVKAYQKASRQYQREFKRAEEDYDREYAEFSEKLKATGNQNATPPVGVNDRLLAKKIAKPKVPPRPPRYAGPIKDPNEVKGLSQKIWDAFMSRIAARVLARSTPHVFSTYSATCAMERTAVYWGVAPYPKDHEGFEPYNGWEQPQARDLGEADLTRVLKVAREWLSTPVLSTKIDGIVRDTQLRAALDLALRAENLDHAIHPTIYNNLLARLAGVSEDETLLTVRSKTARNPMPKNKVELETAQADRFLARLDRMASVVQSNHEKWGMGFEAAKNLVNAIDKLADDLESATYGEDSLLNRQASEIGNLKLAQVLQRDSDEAYMKTFENPQSPIQTEADEPYMKAYKSDDSSGVRNGKSTTGRPLAK